ncbi:hypothetical protein [Saccharopolyspora flava]|uniref:DUF397 domain-containing protein n=1 Tax=Saccharopolyspora flava TaxID=95161 RepID=A0A1I6UL92_9PSEU|nr:hypothetical protein [Saccharopolyspora flava]SFT02057.1 hypothetical protein SAMN05660874_05037 [Saccharopolyspora flava]
MKLTVDGSELTFVKASRSHWDGKECVHVSTKGTDAYLMESDDPSVIVQTTVRNLAVFFAGVKNGEFDHLVVGALEPVSV